MDFNAQVNTFDIAPPTTNEPSILEMHNLNRTFGTGNSTVYALKNVNLKIKKGESVVITGPSGAGKSTLLNILGLLDPNYQGTLKIQGKDCSKLKPAQIDQLRADHIGFIFQDFGLIPYLNVIQNIELGFTYSNLERDIRKEKTLFCLSAVGLEHRATARISTLSGGEKQRVAIARTLTRSPSLLLADEPTGNLDQDNSQKTIELLLQVQRSSGCALVVVTHEPEVRAHFGHGYLVVDGNVEQIDYDKS